MRRYCDQTSFTKRARRSYSRRRLGNGVIDGLNSLSSAQLLMECLLLRTFVNKATSCSTVLRCKSLYYQDHQLRLRQIHGCIVFCYDIVNPAFLSLIICPLARDLSCRLPYRPLKLLHYYPAVLGLVASTLLRMAYGKVRPHIVSRSLCHPTHTIHFGERDTSEWIQVRHKLPDYGQNQSFV